MSHKLKICAALSIVLPIAAWAQSIPWDNINTQYPVSSITPIFSQLLITSIPRGFQMAFANASDTGYIHELVPTGENVNQWTQMLTVTGTKNAALNPEQTPQKMAGLLGAGFHNSCPNSFNAYAFPSPHQINGYDSISVILSCGSTQAPQRETSETALITIIKGQKDYYTVQWAERGAPSSTPINIDLPKWSSRLAQQIKPIKLCAVVAGEKAPYPSCLNSTK
ncbi:hypothetical protein DTO96_100717 [Ephemeroptericola cinctiostellae]|uniref:Uncharacterized protein n=1 Tax=Ephemeroptericola cinctiostellae TaxID=2268024 RepID=A0A345D9G2_9BURK|nr:hypothetical protein [Ephemeroptericola cinctiostellae]AXF85000.1 hypothetical protein DTO96_100717 [Ephemeroptericola cinctiostellae]